MSGMARGAVSLHGKHPFQCGRRNAQPPGNRNIIFYILVHSAAADDQGVGTPQHIPAHINPGLMFLGNAVIQKQRQIQERLPLFLNDSVPEEHKAGIDMRRDMLRRSHTLIVCGSAVDEDVKNDIAVAGRLGIAATTLEGVLAVKGHGTPGHAGH